MSTLVTYASSSEDEEVSASILGASKSVETTSDQARPAEIFTTQLVVDSEPLFGPLFPEDTEQQYDNGDSSNEGAAASERDTIRFLTQATHPMTEMPPSPPGSPNPEAAARFKHFMSLKVKGVHFNEDLAKKSAFKNPAILSSLIDRAGLDDHVTYRTSLPSSVFDPAQFPPTSYKEALLKSQQAIRIREEAEKKALSAAGKRSLDFTSGGTSAGSSATSSPGTHSKRYKR